MPLKQRDTNDTPQNKKIIDCAMCANTKNQAARHRHFLTYDGDLAKHLRESGATKEIIPGILAWVQTMRARYGDRVTEDGQPLSAQETRAQMHRHYQQVFHDTPGEIGHEPRTEKGREITLRVFRHLLKNTKSEYGEAWQEMLKHQFPKIETEAQWADFVRFLAEFQDGGSSEEFPEVVDTRPILRAVGK